MADKRRNALLQREIPSLGPETDPDLELELPPAGPPELDDEMLDAFLPDDEFEPLPEENDFWIE